MCTVSIVASLDRATVRLLVNRDERRLRPVAQPPLTYRTAGAIAVWPRDPVGGGSWIAVNEAGLALVLLNVNGARTAPGMPSRGEIVPLLAGCVSVEDLTNQWQELDSTLFAPFRLVAVTSGRLAVFEQGVPQPTVTPTGRAHVFSSSSLGDDLVTGPRRQLLHQLLQREADPWMAQTRFHLHAWPDRRHLSVMMSRPDACTQSCTEVLLAAESVTMAYRPVVGGWPAGATSRQLAVVTQAERAA